MILINIVAVVGVLIGSILYLQASNRISSFTRAHKQTKKSYIVLTCTIICTQGLIAFNYVPKNSKVDYYIDLKQEHIEVTNRDGDIFIIPHDSLGTFIAQENM